MRGTNANSYKQRRAQHLRTRLMMILGNRCAFCGNTTTLTFDCIKPTGDKHHRMNPLDRMHFYFSQSRAGNVQLLCFNCNVRKGTREQPRYLYGDHTSSPLLPKNLA